MRPVRRRDPGPDRRPSRECLARLTFLPKRRDFNTACALEQPLNPIQFLYRGRDRDSGAVALETPEASVTYGELVREVEALAAAFQVLDPRPGSRVGTCAWNTREHVTALLASYAASKTWVPL